MDHVIDGSISQHRAYPGSGTSLRCL